LAGEMQVPGIRRMGKPWRAFEHTGHGRPSPTAPYSMNGNCS
jgi:hypothetical protein